MMIKSVSKNKGSILVEAMVAMAIFAIGMSFVLLLFVSSSKGALLSLEGTKASLMDTQAMEAVRSVFNDRGWLPVGTYEVGVKDNKEWDIISTDGLVGHWELSGDADDYSGNDNHGTLVGGVTWAEDRMGQARGSAEFDGVEGSVDCGNDESLNITDEITISAWVKGNAFDNYNFAVGKAVTYQLGAKSGKFMIRARFSGIGDTIMSGSTLTTDSWYHMVMTYDGNSFKGYLNGVSDIDSAINDTIIASANNLWISGEQVYSNYWSGQIDDVRIYNRALSEDEIKALYGHYSEKHQSKVTVGDGVTDGLVGYWPMNEGEGNYVYDYSPRTDNWGKMFGPYLDFDGENDYVDCGNDASLNITDAITIEAWVKQGGGGGNAGETRTITIGLPNQAVDFKTGKDGKFIFVIQHTDNSETFDILSIALDQWHHLVGTFQNGEFRMYKDGVLIVSKVPTSTGIKLSTGNSHIGWGTNSAGYFNGLIDDVRIYNRALSAEEISKLYKGELVSDTGLVGHWDMDEGYGGQIRDKSGNGNHGTINGATWGDNSPEWVDDVSGGALEFDGVDDYVDCGNDASLNVGNNSFSISTWVNPYSFGVHDTIVSKWWDGFNRGYSLEVSDVGELSLEIGGSDGWGYFYNSSIFLTKNVMQHISVAFDGNSYLFYLNGVLGDVWSPAYPGARNNNAQFLIGKYSHTSINAYFNGQISDVRIYNRALSADEIQKIYEYGRTNKFYISE